MTKFMELRPMLYTEQLDETVAFYENHLGFTCEERNADWGWASLQRDGVGIMFARPNAHIPYNGPQFSGTFYFNVNDVEQLWMQLKDTVSILYPIETFEWGMREFAITDNNGYTIQFGQETEAI